MVQAPPLRTEPWKTEGNMNSDRLSRYGDLDLRVITVRKEGSAFRKRMQDDRIGLMFLHSLRPKACVPPKTSNQVLGRGCNNS